MKKIWLSLLALALGLTAMIAMVACSKTTLVQFEVPETGNGEIGVVYVIQKVTATDSGGNKIEAAVEVKDHTGAVVDVTDYTFVPTSLEPYTITYAEHGAAFNNEWHPTQISDEYARTGEYSYKVDLFGPNVSWFADKAVFGECAMLAETSYQYLSFWVYFDIEGAGFSGTVLVRDNQYETRFYDERGTEILPRWGEETDGLYEFSDGHWYRWVVDTTKVIAGADGILPSDKGAFQDPGDYSVNLGVWDIEINNNALSAVPVFIDDVKYLADTQALETSLAAEWGPSSKGKKNAEYHTDGTIANYEIPEDVVSTQTCKSEEISGEKVHGGSGALKLVGYEGQTWVTAAKIFRATDARGATRAALWVYIPYDTDDPGAVGTVRLHEGSDQGQTLSGQKAYAQNADGTLRPLDTLQNENKVWYTTIPLNTWACIEFDLPLFGISEVVVVVDGLYMDGAMLTMEDLGTNCLAVYIDDVAYVPEKEYPVIADFERLADGVITPGCARAEISSEKKHGGVYSLRLEGWEGNSWVTANNLFAATDAAGATRISFWAYVPCIKEGENVSGTYKFEELINAEYYAESSEGELTSVEKPLLNTWIRVECDLPADGTSALSIIVSEVWQDGAATCETDPPVVYIDDVCFVTEA